VQLFVSLTGNLSYQTELIKYKAVIVQCN